MLCAMQSTGRTEWVITLKKEDNREPDTAEASEEAVVPTPAQDDTGGSLIDTVFGGGNSPETEAVEGVAPLPEKKPKKSRKSSKKRKKGRGHKGAGTPPAVAVAGYDSVVPMDTYGSSPYGTSSPYYGAMPYGASPYGWAAAAACLRIAGAHLSLFRRGDFSPPHFHDRYYALDYGGEGVGVPYGYEGDAFGGLAYMDVSSFEALNGGVAQPPDADQLHLLQDPVPPSPPPLLSKNAPPLRPAPPLGEAAPPSDVCSCFCTCAPAAAGGHGAAGEPRDALRRARGRG